MMRTMCWKVGGLAIMPHFRLRVTQQRQESRLISPAHAARVQEHEVVISDDAHEVLEALRRHVAQQRAQRALRQRRAQHPVLPRALDGICLLSGSRGYIILVRCTLAAAADEVPCKSPLRLGLSS